jgi:hypothetical protein
MSLMQESVALVSTATPVERAEHTLWLAVLPEVW